MGHVHITVAAIIEYNQKFILVTDKTTEGLKLNQPAGHVEANESILEAAIREVKEETSLDFIPEKLIGVYYFQANPENTYLRFCFSGSISDYTQTPQPDANDDDVIEANWYSENEIRARLSDHRSPIVLRCLDDYLAGKQFPLEVLVHYTKPTA